MNNTHRKAFAFVIALALCGLTLPAVAQVRTVDADFSDWCFNGVTRVPDTLTELSCNNGLADTSEVVFFDAEFDNLVINDLAVIATAQDENFLYFVAVLENDPDPASIPSAQIAIDLVPGGNTTWRDDEGVLNNPNFGADADRPIGGDYLLVFDFANFLLGGSDNAELMEATTSPGTWTSIKFLQPAIFPGEVGGSGGPPGVVEIAIPWSDFQCDGCPEFRPGDAFKFNLMIAQGDVLFPFFTPSGPIEDTISEEAAGTFTTTQDSCTIGSGTVGCELADMSADAFVSVGDDPRVVDADFSDWCFDGATRTEDSAQFLSCTKDGRQTNELVWFDSEFDNLVINDLSVLATTQDCENLYFIAVLENDPDPASIPSAQIAIDVAPGGNTTWRDDEGVLDHPNIGIDANQPVEADYILLFDFANFLLGGSDNAELLEATTNPGSWTSIQFLQPAIFPGEVGGSGGPPGVVEIAVPFSAFDCPGCPEFGPGQPYKFTLMIAAGDVLFPFFTPSGPIEDTITEEVAGTFTTTQDSCTIGTGTTDCELNGDDSADAYVCFREAPSPGGGGAGRVVGTGNTALTAEKAGNGDITLNWGASCLSDSEYGVYEGPLSSVSTITSASPITCSTSGAETLTLTPAAASSFYLVVPSDGSTVEGSYGLDSDGLERQASGTACQTQDLGTCPS